MCKMYDEEGYCDWGMAHCMVCKEHFEPEGGSSSVCDQCMLADMQDGLEQLVQDFDGDIEKVYSILDR